MVRWVFRPYTQVRRQRFARQFRTTQASTKFSPGFTMAENSSPSFGSQLKCSIAWLCRLLNVIIYAWDKLQRIHVISLCCTVCVVARSVHTNIIRVIIVLLSFRRVRAYNNKKLLLIQLLSIVIYSTTRSPVELLGPCFKTGRTVAPCFQYYARIWICTQYLE